MFDVLIKVGGSLYPKLDLPEITTAWAVLAETHRLLLLPGGGPFADQVRVADAHFNLSHSAAHWMAIWAMDQYAYLLADLIPRARLVRHLAAAAEVCRKKQTAILAPSNLLWQLDPLPHSWQITSDSIAAWLAGYAGIQLLVLLKSVTGVYQGDNLMAQVSRQALTGKDIVDPYFGQTLLPETACWLIDGTQPGRLAELLQNGQTQGTRVV